jgi:hypothetical protein
MESGKRKLKANKLYYIYLTSRHGNHHYIILDVDLKVQTKILKVLCSKVFSISYNLGSFLVCLDGKELARK